MLSQTLTVAENDPKIGQVRRIWERVVVAARKLGVTAKMFQTALAYPGTEFEDGIVALAVMLAKKLRGVVTPCCAEETGLIPTGWRKRTDKLEDRVDLGKLDYGYSPVYEKETLIDSDTLFNRAEEQDALGSLGFAAELLKAQKAGKEIFPVKSRGMHEFFMPRTKLLGNDGYEYIMYFSWSDDRQLWVLHNTFHLSQAMFNFRVRFVRILESAAA